MCKYCKNVDTGNDWTPIISKHVNLGDFGDAIMETAFEFKKDESKGAYLATDFVLCNSPEEIIHRRKVNYCPMCGRKFE